MKALITGVNGFVGPYIVDYLRTRHPEVRLYGQAWGESGLDELRAHQPDLTVLEGDLTDPASLAVIFDTVQPDVVIHLAASSSAASSWANPALVFQVNVVGQINLFEAMRTRGISPITVIASSGDVYGRGSGPVVVQDEGLPLQPISPYATSKAAQDLLGYQYFVAHNLPTVRLRLFNHAGPRQTDHFVVSSFARQIAEIEKGRRAPTIEVGNLDAVRDFSDVRDIARAYWLAATRGKPGAAYNVCSGRGVTVRELLDRLLELTSVDIDVVANPGRMRPADIAQLIGNHDLFTEATGWRPEIPLDQTLVDVLDWWREKV